MSLIYGEGINDSDYVVQLKEYQIIDGVKKQVVVWTCPFYTRWKGVLERCYSPKWHKKFPTYKECTVHESWKVFSNFKAWMENQDWEGKHLDKDLLLPGNKIYGPTTCVFVDPIVNLFLHTKTRKKTEWKVGVDLHKGRIRARGMNEFGRNVHLGYFLTDDEAHNAYLKNKARVASILASQQTDPRISEALLNRFSLQGDLIDVEFKEK